MWEKLSKSKQINRSLMENELINQWVNAFSLHMFIFQALLFPHFSHPPSPPSLIHTRILHHRIILLPTQRTIGFSFLNILKASTTHTHMPTGKKNTLTLVSETYWTGLVLVVTFEKVLGTVDIADAEGEWTPLEDLGD